MREPCTSSTTSRRDPALRRLRLEDTPADDPRREDLEEILRAAKKARDVAAELRP
jgi:hypothetical protein